MSNLRAQHSANNRGWRERGAKFCYGPLHPEGVELPCDPDDSDRSAFYFFLSGEHAGKPFSHCKECYRAKKGRHGRENYANHDWAERGTKLCFGPLHPIGGERLPCDPDDLENSAFWFFAKGKREGKPLSRCIACLNHARGRDPETAGMVAVSEVEADFLKIQKRIGLTEMCRRLGISTSFLYRIKQHQYDKMLKRTAVRIWKLAADLERTGERRHPNDIRHGTAARGKDEMRTEWRRKLAISVPSNVMPDYYAAKNQVDETPPDKIWWHNTGMEWLPRYGEEMLGDEF